MIGSRRLFILVLSLLAFLGVVSIVVGILLGAADFDTGGGRTLARGFSCRVGLSAYHHRPPAARRGMTI